MPYQLNSKTHVVNFFLKNVGAVFSMYEEEKRREPLQTHTNPKKKKRFGMLAKDSAIFVKVVTI